MKRCIAALTVMFCAAACGGETNNGGGDTNNSTTPTGGGTNINTTNDNATDTNGQTPTNGQSNTSGNPSDVPHNPDAAVGDSCFTNFECNLDQRCNEVGGGESECEVGERGTKATGELCTLQNDCVSAVCIGRQPNPNICSEECDPDNPACPGDLECVWVPYTGGNEHWCVTPAE